MKGKNDDGVHPFEVASKVPGRLLDATRLKEMYEPMAPSGSSQLPPSEVDEVKKSIQDFRKIFE